MIRIRDLFTITNAKLRSKRLVTLFTVFIPGLLFAALFAAVVIFTGAVDSANEYAKSAFDGRYLVKSTPVIPTGALGSGITNLSEGTINELRTMQEGYEAQQKAEIEKLSLDPETITTTPILIPNPYASATIPESLRVMVNTASPIYADYLDKLQRDYVGVAENKLSDLQALAEAYGAKEFYKNRTANVSFLTMYFMKDGREDLSWTRGPAMEGGDPTLYGRMTSSVRNSLYTFVDDSLVRKYILPENDARASNKTAIPVIITTKEAAILYGEKIGVGTEEPSDASERTAWIRALQEGVNGQIYTACYRNSQSIAQIAKATTTLAEIEANEDNSSYVRPRIVYGLPSEPCGEVSITEDNRTDNEKALALQHQALNEALGAYVEPKSRLITFQVIGVMPVQPSVDAADNISSFLTGLLSAQFGDGALIPVEMYERLPENFQSDDIFNAPMLRTSELEKAGITEVIVEFDSLESAKSFMAEQGCPASQANCDKPFILEPYGVNYLLIEDISSVANTIARYILIGSVAISIVVIWLTVSRIIIDSRRETAVFRALGAKRLDMIQIYMSYGLRLAARIITFTAVAGLVIACVIQFWFGSRLTDYAQASFGAVSDIPTFNLVGLTWWIFLSLVGLVVLVVVAAISVPLAWNVRRNPIDDMRSE